MENQEEVFLETKTEKYGALRLPKDVLDDLAVWKTAYERHFGWRMTYKTLIRGILHNRVIPDEVARIHDEIINETKGGK